MGNLTLGLSGLVAHGLTTTQQRSDTKAQQREQTGRTAATAAAIAFRLGSRCITALGRQFWRNGIEDIVATGQLEANSAASIGRNGHLMGAIVVHAIDQRLPALAFIVAITDIDPLTVDAG